MTYVAMDDREGSLEERGTEQNSFNAVFGARFGARVFYQALAPSDSVCGLLQDTGPLPRSGELPSRSLFHVRNPASVLTGFPNPK